MEVVSINASTREVVIKTVEEHFSLYEMQPQHEIDTEVLEALATNSFASATNIEAADTMLRDKGIVLKLVRED